MIDVDTAVSTLAQDIVDSLKPSEGKPAPTFAEKCAAFKLLLDYKKVLLRQDQDDEPDDGKPEQGQGKSLDKHRRRLEAV